MRKRVVTFILTALLLFSILPLSAFAENHLSKIDVSVVLQKDGSAQITQVWTGTFNEKTENYIGIKNIGNSEITDFTVSDQNGKYETLDEWSIDASFEEKSRKCGVIRDDSGYELCWGISTYGANTYTFSYKMTNLVRSYNDADGFNFMFVNRGLNLYPTDANVTISLANGKLDDSVADIWGFGYEGYINFRSGGVYAYTTKPLQPDDDSSMIIMMSLKKGVLSPATQVDDSFESVKDKAFGGSDYDDDTGFFILLIIFAIIVAIIVIVFLTLYIRRRLKLRKMYNQADYYRGTPNGYNLPASYWLCKNFDINGSDNSIIGAQLLKLMNDGCIEPTEDVSVGLFGGEKKSVSLRLVKPPKESDKMGCLVYNMLVRAAGADGTLQEKELEKAVSKDPDLLRDVIKAAIQAGQNSLKIRGCFKSNSPSSSLRNLTDIGKSELMQLLGLKKYLTDFSLIDEREIKENAIWQDYLVYATLMGIADKTIKQFKKIYPEMVPEFDAYEYNMLWIMSYNRACYNSMHAAEMARSAGSGGASSFGGGGGFSGGGGGGSR